MKKKRRVLKYVSVLSAVIIIIFVAALLLMDNNKVPVITASAYINRGTVITEENIDSLVTVKNVDAEMKTDDVIIDKAQILGKTVSCDISQGSIFSQSVISDEANMKAVMANPVIAGIRASDISQFSGGIIRTGDYIDISVVDNSTGKCSNIISNVYVTGAFNSDGTAIEDEGCAMILNVLIEKENEQYLNEMLSMGTVRICKLERGMNG